MTLYEYQLGGGFGVAEKLFGVAEKQSGVTEKQAGWSHREAEDGCMRVIKQSLPRRLSSIGFSFLSERLMVLGGASVSHSPAFSLDLRLRPRFRRALDCAYLYPSMMTLVAWYGLIIDSFIIVIYHLFRLVCDYYQHPRQQLTDGCQDNSRLLESVLLIAISHRAGWRAPAVEAGRITVPVLVVCPQH